LNILKTNANSSNNRILIVDDQKFNIDALLIILEHYVRINPRFCDYALNGQIAIDFVKSNIEKNLHQMCDYELILIDCEMPFVNGYEATHKIINYL
jgi:CheY-like chemotaxis protein